MLGELGIDFFVRPQKTVVRTATQFTRDDFRYDEGCKVYRCPGGKELRLRRLARSASGLFWEYQADKRDCALCLLRDKCLQESDKFCWQGRTERDFVNSAVLAHGELLTHFLLF